MKGRDIVNRRLYIWLRQVPTLRGTGRRDVDLYKKKQVPRRGVKPHTSLFWQSQDNFTGVRCTTCVCSQEGGEEAADGAEEAEEGGGGFVGDLGAEGKGFFNVGFDLWDAGGGVHPDPVFKVVDQATVI